MVTGIIARKIGMTQVFAADGTVSPATLVKAGPCVVLQAKAAQTDGYEAVQLGLVEEKPAKVNKALGGHYKKADNSSGHGSRGFQAINEDHRYHLKLL